MQLYTVSPTFTQACFHGACYGSCESSDAQCVPQEVLGEQRLVDGQVLGFDEALQPSRGKCRKGGVHKGDCDCCKIQMNTSLGNYYRYWHDTYSSGVTAT